MPTRIDRICQPRGLIALVSLSFVISLMGCGSSNPTYRVHGRVTFEGKALPGGGSIRFVLVSLPGKEAGGTIAADGTFELQTYSPKDGAIAGDHRVEIIQNPILKQAVYPEVKPGEGKEPGPVEPTSPEVRISSEEEIPPAYSGSQSPLKASVKATKSNELNFDLKRTP